LPGWRNWGTDGGNETQRERERERETFSEIFQQRPAFCIARKLAAAVNAYFIDIRRRRIEGWKRHFPEESCVDAGARDGGFWAGGRAGG